MRLHSTASLRYKFQVVRDGKVVYDFPFRNNLILDSGLNKAGSVQWCNCFKVMLLGNNVSPVPVRRDSGGITLAQAANAVTASGAFFQAGDVGRLLKYNDSPGTEVYITAFTDSSHVTVGGPSQVVAAVSGTIWYVNETALSTLYATTSTYSTDGGANGSTAVGGVITHKRTIIGGAVGGTVTLTELGFSDSVTNANIFDRDIIVGGVTLVAGDQPQAVVELIMTYSPTTPLSVGNVATGYDSSGQLQIERLGLGANGISSVQSNGSTATGILDNNGSGGIVTIDATFTLSAFSTGAGINHHGWASNYSLDAYSDGNFYRDLLIEFGTGESNFDIYGFAIGTPSTQNDATSYITQKFTAPFTKNSTQVLDMTFRKSWSRVLTN